MIKYTKDISELKGYLKFKCKILKFFFEFFMNRFHPIFTLHGPKNYVTNIIHEIYEKEFEKFFIKFFTIYKFPFIFTDQRSFVKLKWNCNPTTKEQDFEASAPKHLNLIFGAQFWLPKIYELCCCPDGTQIFFYWANYF